VVLISLLTDFGLADTYVGQLKGAILSIAPSATIVDLSHAVAAQDVAAGAFALWSAVGAFREGSIHVGVVDPGVGSARRGVALRTARGDVFVGPDNGLLVTAAERLGGIRHAVELTQQIYWRSERSASFHGRDIFGPVAAHLSLGVPLEALGPTITNPHALDLPEPVGTQGEVVHVDTYGNLVTNFVGTHLPSEFSVHVGGHVVRRAAYYAAVPPGALLALVGSAGLLEISARDASAAQLLNVGRGTRVTLETSG
jgi:S-adenosyl-L-methionine hydrolase (adenosine-forming)